MKKIVLFSLMIALFAGASYAKLMPGDITTVLDINHETDYLDADQTLIKTKLTFKKAIENKGVSYTPYIYVEDESYEMIWSSKNRKESETGIGIDIVAYNTSLLKVTMGAAYEYEYNSGGDDDALGILKLKAEF